LSSAEVYVLYAAKVNQASCEVGESRTNGDVPSSRLPRGDCAQEAEESLAAVLITITTRNDEEITRIISARQGSRTERD